MTAPLLGGAERLAPPSGGAERKESRAGSLLGAGPRSFSDACAEADDA